jgi:predicted transcriptional regulator
MHAREALNEVMKVHHLKAVDISRNSGVDVYEISKFRNGKKDMTTQKFFKIVNALPNSAKSHLLALCMFENDVISVAEKTIKYKV